MSIDPNTLSRLRPTVGNQAMFGMGAGQPQPQAQPQPAAGGAAPAAPADNSYQNALTMLSNPGHVTTPGATVPQSQPISNQPSVLDQFLQNQSGNKGGGAGGYSNQSFFDTLNKLRSGSTGAPAQ
jgi:hypothetical protein